MLKFVEYYFNFRLLVAHTPRSKNKEKKFSQSHPCWVVEALRNPVMLCLILKFKLGTVGNLEELTTCSQVGRTV